MDLYNQDLYKIIYTRTVKVKSLKLIPRHVCRKNCYVMFDLYQFKKKYFTSYFTF